MTFFQALRRKSADTILVSANGLFTKRPLAIMLRKGDYIYDTVNYIIKF